MDFSTLQARLLRAINRPSTEMDVVSGVKEAINDVIVEMQRDHAFTLTESMAQFDYPAGTLLLDLGTICDGTLRDVIALQKLSTSGLYDGRPIQVLSYSHLQSKRRAYYQSHNIQDDQLYNSQFVGETVEDGFRCDILAFLSGKNIGIYPRPTETNYFLIAAHVWLPELTADTDTNFFLTYAIDLVYMKALKKLLIYMKNTTDYTFTKEDIDSAWNTLMAWDSSLQLTGFNSLT